MSEYIERKALTEKIDGFKTTVDNLRDVLYLDGVLSIIDTFPSADVAPVIRGRWKYFYDTGLAICSNCNFKRNLGNDLGYAISCPNCGAMMADNKMVNV